MPQVTSRTDGRSRKGHRRWVFLILGVIALLYGASLAYVSLGEISYWQSHREVGAVTRDPVSFPGGTVVVTSWMVPWALIFVGLWLLRPGRDRGPEPVGLRIAFLLTALYIGAYPLYSLAGSWGHVIRLLGALGLLVASSYLANRENTGAASRVWTAAWSVVIAFVILMLLAYGFLWLTSLEEIGMILSSLHVLALGVLASVVAWGCLWRFFGGRRQAKETEDEDRRQLA